MGNITKVTFNDGLDKCPVCWSPKLKRTGKKQITCLSCKEVINDHSKQEDYHNISCTCDGLRVVQDMTGESEVKKLNGKKNTYKKSVPCPECRPLEYEKTTGNKLP